MSEINLSYIKIRDREFYLVVGDKIIAHNSTYYCYYPSTHENKCNTPYTQWSMGPRKIELTKKYLPFVESAVNLKLVKESGDYKEWVVESVDENVREKVSNIKGDKGELYCLILENNKFDIQSAKIVKDTEKQIKVEKSFGAKYYGTIRKEEINKVYSEYRKVYSYCHFDKIDELKDEMYEKKKKSLENELKNAKEKLERFNSGMEKEGYMSV